MILSKRVIDANAIQDMYNWVANFENDGNIDNWTDEQQEMYWEKIKKIQTKILKEL